MAAAATPLPSAAPPIPGSTDPIRPNPVKTFSVQPGAVRTASLSPLPSASRKLMPAPATTTPASITTVTTVKSEPMRPSEMRAQATEVASAGDSVPCGRRRTPSRSKAAKAHGDWMIQVGAFDSQTEAQERLKTVQTQRQGFARRGKSVHRTRGERRQGDVPRALCRVGEKSGGNDLQEPQAQRNSMHAVAELMARTIAPNKPKKKMPITGMRRTRSR